MIIKKRIAFFVTPGGDSFIDDIINNLSNEYQTKKVIVKFYEQINKWMEWADICWFEWCDWIVMYASNQQIAKDKKMICRIHSYEAFTSNIYRTSWNNIDKVIFVAENIKNIVTNKIKINKEKVIVIPNGVDINKFNYKERNKGFNIAYIGYINFKKGPMLLLHTFKELVNKDNRYKLYIAGKFQEERYLLYFNQMEKEMGIENNVIFDGWQNDINNWLEDKNYVLSTSVLESQNMSVMQSMSKGIKPIVHNFVGARGIYDKKYLWNNINQATEMINSSEYNSKEYREFIEDNYSLNKQNEDITNMVNKLAKKTEIKQKERPLVTIGIINYNNNEFLDESVISVLNQDYKNIEVLIIDDNSTDGSIEKIKEYEKKYKNIKGIYHCKNSGNSSLAIQETIKIAKGEYFLILSAHDYLFDNSVIRNYINEFLHDKSLDYIYGNIEIVDYESSKKEIFRYKQYTNEEIVYNIFNRMGSGIIPFNFGIFKTDFYRRNKMTFVKDSNNKIGLDTLNTLVCTKYGWNIKYINLNVICHRQYKNNYNYLKDRISSVISVMEYIVKNFNEKLYLPSYKWDEYDTNRKIVTKMYGVGVYYWETAMTYYNKQIRLLRESISLDKEQIKEYIQPLIILSEDYLNKSIDKSKLYDKEINNLKLQINSIKIDSPAILKSSLKYEIYNAGMKKKEELLKQYKNKYLNKNLRILIHSTANGAWYYDFMNWKDIFEYMGIKTKIIYEIDSNKIYGDFDIFINVSDKVYIRPALTNKNIMNIPHKVGISYKENDFISEIYTSDKINLDLMINKFKYDFLLAPHLDNRISTIFKEWIDRQINVISLPLGFSPLVHYPELASERYDYFFAGTNSRLKLQSTQKYLIPIVNNYNGILRGHWWNRNTPSLAPENCRFFYNRSKINLNYHSKIQRENDVALNQRTFIIPACGCFQLVDNTMNLKKYYNSKEVAIAYDEKEYLEKFNYYLNKPKERYEMAYNALIKTYKNKWDLFNILEKILLNIL